jgi:hypothetical protein
MISTLAGAEKEEPGLAGLGVGRMGWTWDDVIKFD